MIKQEIPPKANSTAILYGAEQPQFGQVRIRQRGRLPHWEKEEGLYFITFHLADSLPRKVLEKLTERQRVLLTAKRMGAHLLPDQETLIEEFSPRKLEAYFDRGIGSCALRDARVAELVADALRLWHGKRYRLIAWCVMPNHVHVIFRLMAGERLAGRAAELEIVHGWEWRSILGRTGAFWQREYYDRLIRGEGELDRAVRYVTNNPESALVWGVEMGLKCGRGGPHDSRSGDRRHERFQFIVCRCPWVPLHGFLEMWLARRRTIQDKTYPAPEWRHHVGRVSASAGCFGVRQMIAVEVAIIFGLGP